MTGLRAHTTVLALAALAAILVAGAVGYIAGRSDHGQVFTVGTGIVDAAPSGGTAYYGTTAAAIKNSNGFAYGVPNGLDWIDSAGTFHAGGTPSCTPFYHASRVTMETVKFPVAGGASGIVLWVRC